VHAEQQLSEHSGLRVHAKAAAGAHSEAAAQRVDILNTL
jgi:hypothetical protein